MQITSLSIENFKGIRDRVEISLRPITLLFGSNSVGKSTLLQALLYFRELLERQNVDADRLLVSGASIDLGGFRQFVHKHDLTRPVRIGVTATADDDGLPVYLTPNLPAEANPIAEAQGDPVRSVTIELEVRWDENTRRPWITSYTVTLNGRRVGVIKAEPGLKAALTELKYTHPVFGQEYLPDHDDIEPSELHSALAWLWAEHSFPVGDGRPTTIPVGPRVIPIWGKPLPLAEEAGQSVGLFSEEDELDNRPLAYSALNSIFVGSGELVLRQLKRLRYIGPLRAIPDRSFLARSSPSAERWADGSAAWDLLHQSAAGADDADLVVKTSAIISNTDKLNLGYRLEARHVLQVPVHGFALNTLRALAQSAEDADVEERLKLVLEDLSNQPHRTQLTLVDLKRDTEVAPMDIGAGVTQSIPIVVGVLDPQASIVVVEQPELHTHPAVQCNLADVFVRAVRANQDRLFLIETHSEHLLLRFLRRVREATENEMVEADLKLTPDDLSVVHIASVPEGVQMTSLPVNAIGDFNDQWPEGFFEERAKELF